MNSDLTKEINRVANLKQNKGKSDSFVEKQAQLNLKIREFKNNPLFLDPEDQDLSHKKFKAYLSDYDFDALHDIDTLRSLIFNEVLERKLQQEITKLFADQKYPPEKLTKQMTDIQNQKMSLKVKLGIDKEENQDELTGLETLEKRFEKYIQENRNEFSTVCSCCGKILLLKRRVKDFDSILHPWFAGRWFFNYEILKDVKEGKLTKEDAWRYMCCASKGGNHKEGFSKKYCIDYIDFCLKKWGEITSHICFQENNSKENSDEI